MKPPRPVPCQNPLASEAGRMLARMRDPRKMSRGGKEYYRALAKKRWAKRTQNLNPSHE